MPDDSEHPVTLGDLRVSESMGFGSHKKWSTRPATVADLVSALRAEGVLVREESWSVFGHMERLVQPEWQRVDAEAQPFPPAGES